MASSYRDELTRRMRLPQRHRLLQGYPMLPLHRAASPGRGWTRRLDGELRPERRDPAGGAAPEPAWVRLDKSRPLIIGVLPHSQCNPKVAGCGFCTFAHDRYDKATLARTVSHVEEEIAGRVAAYPELRERRVDALYFGGATANLTPRKQLASLGAALATHFDLTKAEVTLEGVPSLFRSLLGGPFEALLEIPARHRRVSMGVQTFDERWIARMGRQAFGDRRTVLTVIEKAHRHGMTISGDFLINLPGQSRRAMLDDARLAVDSGLDQICVYHLVLTPSGGSEWAKDPALMGALPDGEEAKANWLAVREYLLEHGFVQTTLTNFERASVHETSRRFVYEDSSFRPESYDALGFGPTSISTFIDWAARRAVKHVRGKRFLLEPDDLYFAYEEQDVRLLHLTRTLARTVVHRGAYERLLGADLTAHFGEAIEAVVDAKLATLDDAALRLTAEGMFFADSVAGLLAWRRTEQLRPSAKGEHTRDLLERRVVVDFMG